MYIDFRQKLLASIVGLGFATMIIVLSPWWFALLALCTMVPFFAKVLTA
ncbi:hypothetical protein C482_00940 [Natrialba chahannaoensis JCM 10990]|uniref:Uncharacterized protein n=1 Tax=Natrialba chahannaoensis JCM 10990 TaxID=1227492 RepID=M0B9K0_9EURY|nr:hypothetical protein [Natrialba chahannaoensis]ELZ06344.1 hypothetical protein C482_00940 [Natrialba chahannaoensis JCM 10990]